MRYVNIYKISKKDCRGSGSLFLFCYTYTLAYLEECAFTKASHSSVGIAFV